MPIEERNHCFMHYLGVKTLSETLCSPPLMKAGDGTRRELAARKTQEREDARRTAAAEGRDEFRVNLLQNLVIRKV